MKRISAEKEISYISKVIEKNIDYYKILKDKGFLSENILSQLRNLVEDVAILINNKENNFELDTNYENINPSFQYLKQHNKYKFIVDFYNFLRGTASHYTPSEDCAEKLVSYYFRYLCLIKIFLKEKYGLEIINNIEDFPMYDDESMRENYNAICDVIDKHSHVPLNYIKGKFNIEKQNVIYYRGKIYYELTLTKATDFMNKFERITMYSSQFIPDNYAINISCIDCDVTLNVGKTKIKIINAYKVSIRVCELQNLFRIFNIESKFNDSYKEYENLMKYLTDNKNTITEFLLYEDEEYNKVIKVLAKDAENHMITDSLTKIRNHILDQKPGSNVLRYLTTKLENIVVRDQLLHNSKDNFVFHPLALKNASGPFDCMPYAMALSKHNVSWPHLINSIDMDNREHELLYRTVRNNIESGKMLYTPLEELKKFENIQELVNKFNEQYLSIKKYGKDLLVIDKNFIFIKSYENKSIQIISELEKYLNTRDDDIKTSLDDYNTNVLDKSVISSDKVDVLKTMLHENKIAFIYGSAGTGKTKLIELLSTAFENYQKYYLAVTHTAVSNLSSRIHNDNCTFMTISEFKKYSSFIDGEILFLDECSMISNEDIINILQNHNYKAIILVGDIYQIESIKYSNWFQLCSRYFNKNVIFELTDIHRTKDQDLLELWEAVRHNDKKAVNILSNQEYTQPLSEDIFKQDADDEIVLCLNYDGMYGINNINKVKQNTNVNHEYNLGVDTYKKGDKILFNDCPRFKDFLYNNLKGTIEDIEIDDKHRCWWFTIKIEKGLVDLNNCPPDIDILDDSDDSKINVRFKVNEYADKDDDENEFSHIIPFNLAYAISIHKAQGLEYDSVKIVITPNIEDRITKNIFYTAITRAKKQLKIYWHSDSQTKIFNNFNGDSSNRDISIIRQKIGK
ncbi:MAG: AAA family ATPase [Clostridia bacterium]|nr:AAA family ATPase [Clostridia bacterium]